MIFSNIFSMLKAAAAHIIWTGLLVSFLLFMLNIFLLGSAWIKSLAQEVSSKLWMYVYIKDWSDTTKNILNLWDELKSKWIVSRYVSKDDAWSGMAMKNPDLIQNFQKYEIDNPLPNILYVMFQNEQQFQDTNEVLKKYSFMIDSSKWIDWKENIEWKTLKDQQERSKNVINLTNFVSSVMYGLIIIIGWIIVYFIILGIQVTFQNFYSQIEVEKLIWAPYSTIKIPFFVQTLCVLLLWFGLAYIYRNNVLYNAQEYIMKLFNQDITKIIEGYEKTIWPNYWIQFFILLGISWFTCDAVLNRMIKKIGS